MSAPHQDEGFAWYLVLRHDIPDDDRVHSFSKDAEAERLTSILDIDLLQIPLSASEVEQARRLPGRTITEGGYAEAYSTVATTPGLAMHRVSEVWSRYTGRGVSVAVLDTGLDNRYLGGFYSTNPSHSFIAGEDWSSDPNGHGSHVAGTIAYPTSVGGLRVGVAPGANIMVGKVLSSSGSGSYAGIIRGLEWAVANGAKVINLSLGGPGDKDHPLSLAVDAAARHAVVCVAAGNEQRNTSAPMADQSTPASSREAVTVGAVDSSRRRADFSNVGESVDLCAHGVNAPSLGGSLSGTSMASPHVAGVAALLSETGRDPARVRRALFSGAVNTSLGIAEKGYGILSTPGAVERLTGTPANTPALREIMSRHLKEAWREWKLRPKEA